MRKFFLNTKDVVSTKIQEILFSNYQRQGYTMENTCALWILYGPKALIQSEECVVEITDNFIISR